MDLPHRFEPVLSACGHLPVARFAQLCDTACCLCLTATAADIGEAPSMPSDPAEKEAAAVLAAALAESISRGQPMSSLLTALEERGLSSDHLAAFASVSASYVGGDADQSAAGTAKTAARLNPGQLAHIVGIDWRLDYLPGRGQQQASLDYQLDILTDCPAPLTQPTRIRCSRHQMQDLLAQLREALAAVESAASVRH